MAAKRGQTYPGLIANLDPSIGSTAPQGWQTGYVIALIILGVVFMVAFVVWELYAEHPLIPMNIFKNKDLSLVRYQKDIENQKQAYVLSFLLLWFSASLGFHRRRSGLPSTCKEYGILLL
jgi:hypothetical protein